MIDDEEKGEVRIIVAGGGTGGHLFPGIAIARAVKKRSSHALIMFVVGKKKMETGIILRAGFTVRAIDVEGMLGRGLLRGARALLKVAVSSIQSLFIVRSFRPHLIVGVGGYSSGPVCLVAWLLGIPTAIHEQNSFPGLTNRILSRFAEKVFISFEQSRPYFKKGNSILTGNPIRDDLMEVGPLQEKDNREFVILVMGGSQGARAINRAVVSSLGVLKAKGLFPYVIHQAGPNDVEDILDVYRRNGFHGEVHDFIEDMTSAYRRADMVICRAGATTIAELAALGKPSILIPFPYAARGHQEANARTLVATGGAEMILEGNLSARNLAGKIAWYMENRAELAKMSTLVKKAGRPEAHTVIADQLMELIKSES